MTHEPPKAKVLPLSSQTSEEGVLQIGGCDIRELANEYGTPLYVFDIETLRHQATSYIDAFASHWPYGVEIHYASKAWINIPLARFLSSLGLSFDVVSGGEISVLQQAGVSLSRSAFHGNNKGPQEIEEALDAGIGQIVVNAHDEIRLIESIASELGSKPKILLRVSPGVDAHTHSATTTGLLDSKFGVSVANGEALEACEEISASPHMDFRGIHMHLGSPIFGTEPYVEGIKVGSQLIKQLADKGILVSDFSPGGGFAVAYTDDDDPPDAGVYAKAICETLASEADKLAFPPPKLIIEPGRSISARAGVAIYSVGSRKEIPDVRTYVAVDGGMSDNIRPAIYGSKYEVVPAERMHAEPEETVTIAGKFCESGDILAEDVSLPRLRTNELIAIPAAGAYQLAMESNYNLSLRPEVIMVENGNSFTIRRRQIYEDLTRLDVTHGVDSLINTQD